jgi:metal-dependent amidase/aminoacylase/carboxypeptidase family protein
MFPRVSVEFSGCTASSPVSRASPTIAAESASSLAQRALFMPAEDSSVVLQRVPRLFSMLGDTPLDRDPFVTPAKHSPMDIVDEAARPTGIMALRALALDALALDALLHGVPTLAPAT